MVLFRRWREQPVGSTLIALFPLALEQPGDTDTCLCYMHIGQHGSASYRHVIDRTDPVRTDDPEALALHQELEGDPYGYRLRVIRKRPVDAAYRRVLAAMRQEQAERFAIPATAGE